MAKCFQFVCIVLLVLPLPGHAREQLRLVGSSTVFPFAAASAEQFAHAGKFRTPIVESTGTGGGFKMFCDGIGERYPDMANASRAMKPSELAQCKAHGITSVTELKIGYDGIVLANGTRSANFALTRKALFLALAREVPVNGKLALNPYSTWKQVDPKLPDLPIRLYGRPPSSGTRDAFTDLVMIDGCKEVPEMRALFADEEKMKKHCSAMREDGHYIEAGDDNNLIVQKLISNPESLGIFGYSYLETNAALVKANPVDGVMPSNDTIVDGSYKISRPLFIYIKNANADIVPGLREFAVELASDAASGEDGYLVMKGLLPLSAAEHAAMKRRVDSLTAKKLQ